MKPWREVILPHVDIRRGSFDESVFAADLSDVMSQRGPIEYHDAISFFRTTFPTEGIKKLLATVLNRLAGSGPGEGVIQIQTPFGGGKTHSLIALYHLFLSREELGGQRVVAEILDASGLKKIPTARVAGFVGTAADPIKGQTIWGSIADQFGQYELLKEHDKMRRAPGKDLLHQLLGGEPTLILLDEITEYAVKAKDYLEQVLAFFQELTETVKVLPHAALVATLPSSAPYGEEGERVLSQLQRIFGRVEAIYTPVEGEEIYEVIRRRLFENSPDPNEVNATAQAYWQLYRELGEDIPREAREPAYREKIRKAYPLHPELIDVLFERWSTYPTFQRTRGVLRFLAEVVADLYKSPQAAPLIQPAHLDLSKVTIRRELIKHIGNEYEGVIAADIANGNAKAQRIDQDLGSEYARHGVARGLATAIFFASFSGAERRGVGIQRLRLALLRPGILPAIIGDALHRMEEELWYVHVEGGLYRFSNRPNLNRVILEWEETIKDEDITSELKERVEKAGQKQGSWVVYLWPRVSQEVPDDRNLKLALLGPSYVREDSETEKFVAELLRNCGDNFRVYRNTLVVMVMEENGLATLRSRIKRYLALCKIKNDRSLMGQLGDESRKLLENKLKDSEAGMNLLEVYRHMARAGEEDVEWRDLGIPTWGEEVNLVRRVSQRLTEDDVLVTAIGPDQLLKKTLRPEDRARPLKDVVEAFLKYPHLPMIDRPEVVREAVRKGVQEGVFALKSGEQRYFKEALPSDTLEEDAELVRPVEELRPDEEPTGERTSDAVPLTAGLGAMATAEGPESARPQGPQVLTLRVQVPRDRFYDFFSGVVTPLNKEGSKLLIEVLLRAEFATGGPGRNTMSTVDETLKQIGAEILQKDITSGG